MTTSGERRCERWSKEAHNVDKLIVGIISIQRVLRVGPIQIDLPKLFVQRVTPRRRRRLRAQNVLQQAHVDVDDDDQVV
jgi:hypothetical protein